MRPAQTPTLRASASRVFTWPSMLLLQAHFDSKLSSRRKKLANSVSKALTGQERQKVRR